jgi:hypothetical protein
MCVVFDHNGILQNPRGLERDLEAQSRRDGVAVIVSVADRSLFGFGLGSTARP